MLAAGVRGGGGCCSHPVAWQVLQGLCRLCRAEMLLPQREPVGPSCWGRRAWEVRGQTHKRKRGEVGFHPLCQRNFRLPGLSAQS